MTAVARSAPDDHLSVSPHRSADAFTVAILALVLVGAGLRLWAYGGGRSLWLDEAMIALNIIHLPLSELFGPLQFDQFAPLGWIALEKASFAVIPGFEYSLRLPALMFGIAALGVFCFLARPLLPRGEAALAVALFAISANLIYYSAEAKPYILDAFFSAAILALAHRSLIRPAERIRLTVWLAVTGALCTVLTFGALLVLAAAGLVLFAAATTRRDRPWIIALILTGALWCCTFGILYLAHYGEYSANIGEDTFAVYWTEGFAPAPISRSGIVWYAKTAHMLLNVIHNGVSNMMLVTGANAVLTGGLLLIGLVTFLRRAFWSGLLFILPLLFAVLASAIEAYPMMGRFQLALAPPVIILIARGTGAVAGLLRRERTAFVAVAALLLATPVASTLFQAFQSPPWSVQEIEPDLAYVARNARAGDLIVVPPKTLPAFLLYASRDRTLDGMPVLTLGSPQGTAGCDQAESVSEPGLRRMWFLVSHVSKLESKDNAAFLAAFASNATVRKVPSGTGTKLYEIFADAPDGLPVKAAVCRNAIGLSPFERKLAEGAGLVPAASKVCGVCAR